MTYSSARVHENILNLNIRQSIYTYSSQQEHQQYNNVRYITPLQVSLYPLDILYYLIILMIV